MQQMKRDGVQPDIHTYTSFINACCRAGDMQVNYMFSQKNFICRMPILLDNLLHVLDA